MSTTEEDILKAKLSDVVEKTADGVFITDMNGIIEYVNPAFEEITGYTKEVAIGKTPRILKSGKHGLNFYKKFWETILSGKVHKSRIINKKRTGRIFTYCLP